MAIQTEASWIETARARINGDSTGTSPAAYYAAQRALDCADGAPDGYDAYTVLLDLYDEGEIETWMDYLEAYRLVDRVYGYAA